MSEGDLVNGIDVAQLHTKMDAMREAPELAAFRLRARHRWIDGAHVQTTIQDFYGAGQENASRWEPFVLEGDEPEILLGTDQGPNATEAALHALASCLSTTFIYHAATQGVRVDGLELELEGDLDLRGFLGLAPEVRNGYQAIRVTLRASGDAPEGKLKALCDLAQKRSPVFDVMTNGVAVSVQFEAM
ncbi:MAG: OsmC family protein [Planctomycetota bacterium]|jgi:uncharacterized OsmC-like protein